MSCVVLHSTSWSQQHDQACCPVTLPACNNRTATPAPPTKSVPSLQLQAVEHPLHRHALAVLLLFALLSRSTELMVLVQASQTSVGIHCCNLSIHSVTVNGVAAQV
jgi:hypothetical protein